MLIMDEPTNHLDIQSKEIIKIALQKFQGTLIVISHDREFLQGLSDKIFEFRDGKMKEFLGTIDEYLEYRQKESIREISMEKSKLDQKKTGDSTEVITKKAASAEIAEEPQPANSGFVTKEQKNLQNKLKKTEEKIADYEKEIAQLENLFTKTNPTASELVKYEELKSELEQTLTQWEEIAAQLEA